MNTIKKYRIPIFNYGMTVRIYDYKEDVLDIPDFEGVVGRTIEHLGHCIVIIKNNDFNTMVHEAVHVKNLIWNYIGYTPQRDNDEVDAYLVTYIYGKLMKAYKEHNERFR